jgi:DNA sulfur modification protein DndD
MILNRLILHDFGIYRGRQELDLTPISPERPIILIGARNGRGKTTILDAINLVLYGSRANLSNRLPRQGWDEYLRSCVHQPGATSALVGLEFSVVDDFGVRHYLITRAWELAPRGVNESFSVTLNGQRDDVLAEDWGDHLEGLLPLEIASLNFFDGEKTNELATPERSKEVIRSAIRGLLGLGILERLEADLKVLIRRKQDVAIGDAASETLLAAESELAILLERRSALVLEMAESRTLLERARDQVKRKEALAREVGVERWEQRAEIESELISLRTEHLEVEQQMQIIAAGVAPLAIVESLLARAETQVSSDQEIQKERLVLDELELRDQAVVNSLSDSAQAEVLSLLAADRKKRLQRLSRIVVHRQPGQISDQIRSARAEIDSLSEIGVLLARMDLAESRTADAERKLMGVPTDGQLMPVLEELGRLKEQADISQRALDSGEEEMRHLCSVIERLEGRISSLREAEADRDSESMQECRAREYAAKALETLTKLATTTVVRNIAAIEASILESFNQLVGKTDLVTRVRLEPDTLEMSVDTLDGQNQPVERLSAGERQLLAVAILWGLSRVAHREVPLVVDTPLGRLDSFHREKLALNYFPKVAKQVIILSTDEEFDLELREKIEIHISRDFLIEFSDVEKSSHVTAGYFLAGVK